MGQRITIDDILDSPTLPTLPAVAVEVLRVSRDPESGVNDLADVILNDQALATRILSTINTPFYGLAQRCSKLSQAVGLLGRSTVRTLALSFSLVKTIDGGSGTDDIRFDFVTYWRRAVYSAAGARRLAGLTRACDPEEAFLAALMQDVGMIALYCHLGEVYLQTVDLARTEHRRLRLVEVSHLGVDHATVGAAMAQHWLLADQHVAAVRYHETPDEASPEHQQIARIVHAATIGALSTGSNNAGPLIAEYHDRVAEWFSLDREQSCAVLKDSCADAAQLSQALALDTGESPPIDGLLQQAAQLLDDADEARAA